MRRVLAGVLWVAGVCGTALSHAQPITSTETTPGCAWAHWHPDQGPSVGAWGKADILTQRPNDADTLFNIASVSKPFTALAVLLLAQDKQVDLDAPLAQYLPHMTGELGRPTLRQMLRHTSGLPDYIAPLFDAGREHETATSEDALAVILQQPHLEFAPGTRFAYSNTGYFLLAQVVERVSGQSLAAFSSQYIFQPLGMHHTVIVDHYPSRLPALARAYENQDGRLHLRESSWEQTGDGQVHTSAQDMLRWLQHVAHNTSLTTPRGAPAAGLLTLLTEDAAPRASKPEDSYHFGLEAVSLGEDVVWAHEGGWAGYRSFMAYAPNGRRGAAVLCNTTDVNVKAATEALLR